MAFKKGQSGNPGGRPKGYKEARELARKHTVAAIKGLAEIASDKDQPAAARVAAFNSLLDRAWGKAAQPQTGEGGEGPAQLMIVTGVSRDDD